MDLRLNASPRQRVIEAQFQAVIDCAEQVFLRGPFSREA
jgi:hypothetical protein